MTNLLMAAVVWTNIVTTNTPMITTSTDLVENKLSYAKILLDQRMLTAAIEQTIEATKMLNDKIKALERNPPRGIPMPPQWHTLPMPTNNFPTCTITPCVEVDGEKVIGPCTHEEVSK